MTKIRQLSALEAQKIAAGEVVERPANVVKELIENALDAGASTITLYLEDAGKSLIRCIDNGSGMSVEDARACILHHATSKITSVDDLDSLSTFGFRGEALSSIAAVSHLSITTRELSAESGIKLDIEQGLIVQESVVAAPVGTDIALKDLFFNVPARKKFLKTKETEWRAIVLLFQALCLAYQHVSFKLYHDNKLIYNYPSVPTLAARMAQLFEPSLIKNILEETHHHETMPLSCTAAFTTPSYTRFDRNQIFLFVNKRWVKNYKLAQALIKGYTGMLPTSKYPAGCVFITLDPQSVDVNIHPRKEEVHFTHPRTIEYLIESTVQKKLEEFHAEQLGKAPAIDQLITKASNNTASQSYQASSLFERSPFYESFKPAHAAEGPSGRGPSGQRPFGQRPFGQEPLDRGPFDQRSLGPCKDDKTFLEIIAPHFTQEGASTQQGTPSSSSISLQQTQPIASVSTPQIAPVMNFRLIGQLALTYILIETDKGLVLVDQHAAHERILYERFKATFDNPARIRLLAPQIIVLTKEDAALIEPYLPLISSFGIDAQLISDHQLSIQETSIYTKNLSLEDCIKQALSALHEHASLEQQELKVIIQERFHASMSCKAAAKAGDILSFESMHRIITDLSTSENRLSCPHGRPTVWELTKSDIEKKFKRDYR